MLLNIVTSPKVPPVRRRKKSSAIRKVAAVVYIKIQYVCVRYIYFHSVIYISVLSRDAQSFVVELSLRE